MAGYGAALQFAEAQFGGPVAEEDAGVSVGTTATQIVAENPDGVVLAIVNNGSVPMWVSPNNKVSDTNGIQIAQNGGSMTLKPRDDGTLPARAWYGIAPSGPVNAYYVRLVRYAELPKA